MAIVRDWPPLAARAVTKASVGGSKSVWRPGGPCGRPPVDLEIAGENGAEGLEASVKARRRADKMTVSASDLTNRCASATPSRATSSGTCCASSCWRRGRWRGS